MGSFQMPSLLCMGQLIATCDDLIPDDASYRQCPGTALCEFQNYCRYLGIQLEQRIPRCM